MIKYDVTYENFEGKEVTKTLHFHLNNQELQEIGINNHDMVPKMISAIENGEVGEMYKTFKKLVVLSYGVRVDDDTFVKDDNTKMFEHTLAFSAFMQLVTEDAMSLITFMKGVLPKKVAETLPSNPEDYTEEKTQELVAELKSKINA